MLWRPSTYGESLFLEIYSKVGKAISLQSDHGFDYLVSGDRFQDFTRLVASLEVFYRCLRCAERFQGASPHLPATSLAKELRLEVDLPVSLADNRSFAEIAKQAGRVVHEARTFTAQAERELWRNEVNRCYLCGVTLLINGGDDPKARSVDHLWPLSLAGESVLDNLFPACKGCNSKRGHSVTWASGPVAGYHLPKQGTNFPASWRFALAMFSLVSAAGSGKRLLTLKDAARNASPIVPNIDTAARTPFVFFETIKHVEMSR